jgi:hypothetical protein
MERVPPPWVPCFLAWAFGLWQHSLLDSVALYSHSMTMNFPCSCFCGLLGIETVAGFI